MELSVDHRLAVRAKTFRRAVWALRAAPASGRVAQGSAQPLDQANRRRCGHCRLWNRRRALN